MIISEIYAAVSKALIATGSVKYVDLWNHNVEFIEQETDWERPAVFIEFQPIEWKATQAGVRYVTESSLQLHIVTDWSGGTSSVDAEQHLEVLDLLDTIHSSLRLLEGAHFTELQLGSTVMNHNHEDIVETIERYDYVGYLEYEE